METKKPNQFHSEWNQKMNAQKKRVKMKRHCSKEVGCSKSECQTNGYTCHSENSSSKEEESECKTSECCIKKGCTKDSGCKLYNETHKDEQGQRQTSECCLKKGCNKDSGSPSLWC
ncbi:hypothetical protein NW066_06025 [Mycoplasmopsis felis]|uniref:hypothetical protein n=1 Tax=Mycoplasmopsis felis TaxID=33923 RepID=UPI0021AFDBB4|nr:hypothetical protein [Mycoplasmopsis felis]UWV85046.1 hypothetical protein NW066_06025 [Mycoplasmopsis felis]